MDISEQFRHAVSWCDVDLTFDLPVVTLNFKKNNAGYISDTP